MRILSLFCFFYLFISFVNEATTQNHLTHRCNAQIKLNENFELYPEKFLAFQKQEKAIIEFIENNRFSLNRSSINIPVVIHIVHRTADQNISDLQIFDQLDILNRAFSAQNRNLHTVPPKFRHLITDVGIQFCLAQLDEKGNSTNGIVRTKTSIENAGTTRINGLEIAVHFSENGGSDPWDPEKYLNIWVTEMENNIAGSATFPGMAPYPQADGIIMNYKYFGSIGSAVQSAPYNKGKTLVHEVGHYFNLFHPWGPGFGGCEADDFVDDTPLQEGPYFECCPSDNFSCDSEDLVVNFMDYTEDECLAMFTHGQKQRMLASIQLFRSGLIENAGACNNDSNSSIVNPTDFRIVKPESINRIYIYSPEEKIMDFKLEIFNIKGQEVWTEKLTQTSFHQVDVSAFTKGIYIICIHVKDHFQCTKIPIF